jgi:hypothetical protein
MESNYGFWDRVLPGLKKSIHTKQVTLLPLQLYTNYINFRKFQNFKNRFFSKLKKIVTENIEYPIGRNEYLKN